MVCPFKATLATLAILHYSFTGNIKVSTLHTSVNFTEGTSISIFLNVLFLSHFFSLWVGDEAPI